MNQLGPLVAVAVVVATIVQIVAFYYLMKGNDGGSGWPSSTEEASGNSGVRSVSATDHDDASEDDSGGRFATENSTTQCPHCGTHNEQDQMFTFCRNCGSEL